MENEKREKIVEPDTKRGAAAEPRVPKQEPEKSPPPPDSTSNDNE
jgi:hypothetical protein